MADKLSPDTATYADWLATHVFSQADARLYQSRMEAWAATPRFHVALIQDGAGSDALARSIRSLGQQYYPQLAVTVVADVPAPAGATGSRLDWQQAHGDCRRVANRALSAVDADWLCLIRAGDEVAPHAFLLAAEAACSHPDWQAMYSDEDRIDAAGKRSQPRFKPDFDIELLRSTGYLGGMLLLRRSAWSAMGGWATLARGQDELATALALAERHPAEEVGHLADVLYHRSDGDPALTAIADEVRSALVAAHLHRLGIAATVVPGLRPETLHVRYRPTAHPRVSILIPSKNQFPLLQRCISSLIELTDYPDFEVLVIDNGSTDRDALDYLDGIRRMDDPRLKVIVYDEPFNFAAMNNLAATAASGELLLLLNNDTAVVHREWLGNMVALSQQSRVGAVGARLLFPDGSVQHAGVVLGLAGPAEHPFIGWPADSASPMHLLHATRQVSAVTAACMLVPRKLYLELGGMDERQFKVSYNDVDLCLKIGAAGYRILWHPYATLLHEGSASQRQLPVPAAPGNTDKTARFAAEQDAMHDRWMPRLVSDPAYNPNLSLGSRNYEIEAEAVLSWNPTPWRPLPRVLLYPADFSGSGEVRILSPMRALDSHLRIRGFGSMRSLSRVEIAKADVDSVVIQRPINRDRVDLLRAHKQFSPARCLVDIDDLITAIPPKSPHFRSFDRQALAHFDAAAALGDCLLVSTPPLAQAFSHLNSQVIVVPNYLDGSRWLRASVPARAGARPRVGWAGSISHAGDLELMFPVVKELAKEVDWVFLGLCPPAFRRYAKEVHRPVPVGAYPDALASLGLDLAVAPLEMNAFNEAKSPLKLLEYGALGYPVVCTDILPYQGDFPVTRVPNRARDWIEAIRAHLADRDEALRRGAALRSHVQDHWLLENHLDEWLAAWLP
ncbi:MAG: glycosyltransferase [Rhodocyclales bacterium]|nr:glycosyltransferase [Rhodocyclales bacterium]